MRLAKGRMSNIRSQKFEGDALRNEMTRVVLDAWRRTSIILRHSGLLLPSEIECWTFGLQLLMRGIAHPIL